jgi:hypothetical protein
MRRNQRNSPSRRINPLRELMLDRQRSAEIARNRQRAEKLKSELPTLIEDQVGEHMQKLESKLLDDFKKIGEQAVEQSAAVLGEQLNERIETLEQISSIQSRSITKLRDSSKIADQKVGLVVNSIEKTLSAAVPGFRLEAPKYSAPRIESRSHLVRTKPADLEEMTEDMKGKCVFCPNCTSTKVRRANRQGLWEELLRFFFIAPFRCRACRHKFYRF